MDCRYGFQGGGAHPKAFILCNPQNPIGRVWSRDELKRMGDERLKRFMVEKALAQLKGAVDGLQLQC